ncbi:MAG: hypothetical protein JWP33_1343 [Blastococcus sp.]|jgi:hypothetical protein|nr:hypothetical protein [Blastococcus sp.]
MTTKVVKVTPAQVNAAKMKIKRSAVTGEFVKSSVSQIANAKRALPKGSGLRQRGK